MQLKTAKIFRRGSIRRAAEEDCEQSDVPDIVVARLFDEVAHGHVFDHPPAQRADGLLTHRGAPVLRWRSFDPSILKTGRPARHLSRSLDHSIVATGSGPARSALPRSGFVLWPIAAQGVHRGMAATGESRRCGNTVADGFDVVDGARSRHRSVIGWSS